MCKFVDVTCDFWIHWRKMSVWLLRDLVGDFHKVPSEEVLNMEWSGRWDWRGFKSADVLYGYSWTLNFDLLLRLHVPLLQPKPIDPLFHRSDPLPLRYLLVLYLTWRWSSGLISVWNDSPNNYGNTLYIFSAGNWICTKNRWGCWLGVEFCVGALYYDVGVGSLLFACVFLFAREKV